MGRGVELSSSRSLARMALFAALVAVLGLVPRIDLPFAVPVTAQTLGVMLAGCLLPPLQAFLALLLLLGGIAAGLPLLSGGRGGVGAFATPSLGFLLGWPFAAAAAALAMRLPGPIWLRAFAASVVGGIGVEYLCGIIALAPMAHLTLRQAALGSLVFLPGDLVKAVLAALVTRSVVRALPGWQD